MLDMFFIPWTPCLCHRKCRCCRAARKRFRALVCLAPSLHRPSGPQESLRTWFASKFCAAIKSLFQHQCFRIITWIYFYVFTYFCKTPCNMCLSAILLGHSVRNLTDYRCDACISESFAPCFILSAISIQLSMVWWIIFDGFNSF